jgi:hypothetical protein
MSIASTSGQVRRAIRASEDQVFTTRDILNASPEATRDLVDQVISRMVRSGELQRVSRGLFSLPKMHSSLGPLPPAADDIAAAVERSLGVPVTPTGALALNALHLSTQVPAKPEFLTAGPSRTIYVRNLPIRLKNASARRFRIQNPTVRLIIEALRTLGREQVTEAIIGSIRSSVSAGDRVHLGKHIGDAPVWMQPYLRQIATT